jgi:hypothetical protein
MSIPILYCIKVIFYYYLYQYFFQIFTYNWYVKILSLIYDKFHRGLWSGCIWLKNIIGISTSYCTQIIFWYFFIDILSKILSKAIVAMLKCPKSESPRRDLSFGVVWLQNWALLRTLYCSQNCEALRWHHFLQKQIRVKHCCDVVKPKIW